MKTYDQALTELQRMRKFLERFSEITAVLNAKSPIEALDFLAKKEIGNLAKVTNAIFVSTVIAHMLQRILVNCLSSRPQQAQAPFSVDSKVLH